MTQIKIKLSYTGKTGSKLHAIDGCSTKLGNHFVGNRFFTKDEFGKLERGMLCEVCINEKSFDWIAKTMGVWIKQTQQKPWDKPTWKRTNYQEMI